MHGMLFTALWIFKKTSRPIRRLVFLQLSSNGHNKPPFSQYTVITARMGRGKMHTISLCMIVKNEEKTLSKCLDSVRGIADEIVIVDTGSTDSTKAVARAYTPLVYDFDWVDDFSLARNFAFDKGTGEYLMWMDADDILLAEDRALLKELKENLDPDVDVVMMKYNTGFDANGKVTFSYYRERLVKRSCGFRWMEPVHEYLQTGGKIINSEICITHTKTHYEHTGRNLRIYEKLLAAGTQLTPRGLYYFARELKDNGRFREASEVFNRFLETGEGWAEDNISACLALSQCYAHEGRPELQLQALTRSFCYDTPRAEICCEIGYFYKSRGDYGRAVFWFQLVLSLKKPEGGWGFMQNDCWGYIPSIELAVCYDRLGDIPAAVRCNELAEKFKPGDPSAQYNRTYFKNKERMH